MELDLTSGPVSGASFSPLPPSPSPLLRAVKGSRGRPRAYRDALRASTVNKLTHGTRERARSSSSTTTTTTTLEGGSTRSARRTKTLYLVLLPSANCRIVRASERKINSAVSLARKITREKGEAIIRLKNNLYFVHLAPSTFSTVLHEPFVGNRRMDAASLLTPLLI